MNLSSDAFLGLKRHFLGALTEPSRVRLVPAPGPLVIFSSRGTLRPGAQGCTLDLGTLPQEESRWPILRATCAGEEALTLTLPQTAPGAVLRWAGAAGPTARLVPGESVDMELVQECPPAGSPALARTLEIRAESVSGQVRLFTIHPRSTVHPVRPLGRYSFQDSPEPRPFDFGTLFPAAPGAASGPRYILACENLGQQPLVVAIEDLPSWLTFEIDGFQRRGPAAGRFFERAAPFTASLFVNAPPPGGGRLSGRLVLRTNDTREPWRTMILELAATTGTSS
jgi:hypothetical protein